MLAVRIAVVATTLALWGQPSGSYDPGAVLERTRARLLAELARLPHYTCVQTITRQYYRPASQAPESCGATISAHESRRSELSLRSWDRLRLEVAIVDGQDIYSWVGAAKFEEGNLEELAGRGPLGSGDFGPFLNSVFRLGTISYKQAKVVNGHELLEYSYDVPLSKSEYSVRTSQGWTLTAYSGSLLVDPDASDVVNLTVVTAELPESNPSCQYMTNINYGRTIIHGDLVLIPEETQLNTIDRGGGETASRTTYEKCRAYGSKSRILPENTLDSASVTPAPAATPTPLPPGLLFEARIVTPIDSSTAAAGDPIEAVLRSSIWEKKNRVRIPAGSRIHGRLVSFERRSGSAYQRYWAEDAFWFSVHLESIEVNGVTVPLRAFPESFDPLLGSGVSVPASAHIFTSGKQHLQLQHLDWRWVTTDYNHDQENRSPAQVMGLQREVEIANGEYAIDALSAAYFHFSVPDGASSVRLEGTFDVIGPPTKELEITPKDVNVFLVSKKEFENWQNGNPPAMLYQGGRMKSGSVQIPLPSGSGTYYLVFDNDSFKKNQVSSFRKDPLNPKRQLRAVLRLRYNH